MERKLYLTGLFSPIWFWWIETIIKDIKNYKLSWN